MTTVAELMLLADKPVLLEVQLAALVQERDQLLVDLNEALIDLDALKARLAAIDVEQFKGTPAEDLAALRSFAQKLLEGFPENFGDVDGFTIHDAAVECGLLEGETRHEPCCEVCNCASYHGDMSDGVKCYRRTALLMGIPSSQGEGS